MLRKSVVLVGLLAIGGCNSGQSATSLVAAGLVFKSTFVVESAIAVSEPKTSIVSCDTELVISIDADDQIAVDGVAILDDVALRDRAEREQSTNDDVCAVLMVSEKSSHGSLILV